MTPKLIGTIGGHFGPFCAKALPATTTLNTSTVSTTVQTLRTDIPPLVIIWERNGGLKKGWDLPHLFSKATELFDHQSPQAIGLAHDVNIPGFNGVVCGKVCVIASQGLLATHDCD